MSTPRKSSTAPRKSSPTDSKYNHLDLPATGSKQFRHGGDYKTPLRALAAFAKSTPTYQAPPQALGHVKALIHLGWSRPNTTNDASKSPACQTASAANLPTECWDLGQPAAPQISANLRHLEALGANPDALDALWSAYMGM